MFRTRRTEEQVKFFIECWLAANTTREVIKMLRCSRKNWPYSIEKQSVAFFAASLRRSGVKLPWMEHRGNELDVVALNSFIASC